MKITLNDRCIEISGENHLEKLLEDLKYPSQYIAVAVNGKFIPREKRNQCRLCENDKVEIVAPMQGG